MNLPERFSLDRLTLPFRLLYWSCRVSKNDWIGVFLLTFPFICVGIALHFFYHETITRGLWFALIWTGMTFAMLRYGYYRIQAIFDQLQDIMSTTKEANEEVKYVRASAFAYYNNRYYYIVSIITILITFPFLYLAFIERYSSVVLQMWSALFFLFTAFIGGYGMACAVAFNRIVKEIIDNTPFELNPYHPDRFMGLKPLGNLSVANALLASSSSLLFPLIFESIYNLKLNDVPVTLGYLIFAIIMTALVASFVGPLFIIKDKIEKGKFAVLIAHENEYQALLDKYKKDPAANDKDIIQLLSTERSKLQEIRLFPFEAKMLFQIIVSILLPIIMLVLQIYLKK